MNKKKMYTISGLVLICLIIIIELYNTKLINKNNIKNNLAIMVKEDGATEYSSVTSIPKGDYIINEDKTICENGGKISNYNNTTGQVKFNFLGSDRCTLYFDYVLKPKIDTLSLSGIVITATVSDKVELSGYAISDSNTVEPSSYTPISGKSVKLTETVTEEKTVYLWVKNKNNLVSVSDPIEIKFTNFYDQILLNNPTVSSRNSFSTNYVTDTTSKIFKETSTSSSNFTEDTNGNGIGEDVYYFAGSNNLNWVKFGEYSDDWYSCYYSGIYTYAVGNTCEANYTPTKLASKGDPIYWRIIRTNEDSGVRLLYSGTSPKTTTAYVGTSQFIKNGGDESTYTYKSGSSVADSTIKDLVDTWYMKVMMENYSPYISKTATYCNDIGETDTYISTTSEIHYYGAYYRLNNNKRPSYKCGGKIDGSGLLTNGGLTDHKYSTNTTYGNGLLVHYVQNSSIAGDHTVYDTPVALITADEIAYAGGTSSTNTSSWFDVNSEGNNITGGNMWYTLSPGTWSWLDGNENVRMWSVTNGALSYLTDTDTAGKIRPVISLKSCVKYKSGNGSPDSPYEVLINDECKSLDN